jgi:tRNA (cmo5U34)-methyltransferase
MNTEKIKERFNTAAEKYDAQRKEFIPCFDDYYGMMIGFLAKSIPRPSSILDLGAGTGLLSKYLYDQFPEARYTLVDISEQMMEVARKRFHGLPNFAFSISDYSKKLPDGDFDLITSALSIHHLENTDKARLYRNIHDGLPENGCLINLDQFNAASPYMNKLYNAWWYEHIRNGSLPKDEHAKWLERRKLDRENTIDETLRLLGDAGFDVVECIYSFMKFAVVVALKGTGFQDTRIR